MEYFSYYKISLVLNLIMALALVLIIPNSHAQDSPQDILKAHNDARALVGVGPMTWDDTVAGNAESVAQSCSLKHSRGPYGENIAWGWGTGEVSGVSALQMWVKEKADYKYATNSCTPGKVCGHYTQVVWRNSVRLGCAKVWCDNIGPPGGTFIVCNFDSAGNISGEKPY